MKANAPEKVYLHLTTGSRILNGKYYENKPAKIRYDDKIIEYILTDYAEKEFLIKAKRFLSEIHRVCDITDEHGYRIELRDLQAMFEKYVKGEQNGTIHTQRRFSSGDK